MNKVIKVFFVNSRNDLFLFVLFIIKIIACYSNYVTDAR